ncbi:hypothetical protein C7T35_31260 [Variovorax sp. WS11]|nr:hypothetical protein C7T35_31260 [Variovorax sp. WS11]
MISLIAVASCRGKAKRLESLLGLLDKMNGPSSPEGVKNQVPVLAVLCLANTAPYERMAELAPVLPKKFPSALARYRDVLITAALLQLERQPADVVFDQIRQKVDAYGGETMLVTASPEELVAEIRFPAALLASDGKSLVLETWHQRILGASAGRQRKRPASTVDDGTNETSRIPPARRSNLHSMYEPRQFPFMEPPILFQRPLAAASQPVAPIQEQAIRLAWPLQTSMQALLAKSGSSPGSSVAKALILLARCDSLTTLQSAIRLAPAEGLAQLLIDLRSSDPARAAELSFALVCAHAMAQKPMSDEGLARVVADSLKGDSTVAWPPSIEKDPNLVGQEIDVLPPLLRHRFKLLTQARWDELQES